MAFSLLVFSLFTVSILSGDSYFSFPHYLFLVSFERFVLDEIVNFVVARKRATVVRLRFLVCVSIYVPELNLNLSEVALCSLLLELRCKAAYRVSYLQDAGIVVRSTWIRGL
jgi:hypothetical protein